jgi:hypothetical protein
MLFINSAKTQERLLRIFRIPISTSIIISSLNRSKWEKN